MAKKTFETMLEWKDGNNNRLYVRVEVGVDGWGKVYDKADGLYCGSLNPIRTRQLMQEAVYEK